MRVFGLSVLFCTLSTISVPVLAQDDAQLTARERLLQHIEAKILAADVMPQNRDEGEDEDLGEKSEIVVETVEAVDTIDIEIRNAAGSPAEVNEIVPEEAEAPENPEFMAPLPEDLIEEQEAPPETQTDEPGPEAMIEAFLEELPATSPEPIVESNDIEEPPALLPFYLTTREYLQARKSDPQLTTRLDYKMEKQPLDEFSARILTVKPVGISITVGEDFAKIKRDGGEKIYDFKHKRLLAIKPGTEFSQTPVFDNSSLYAKAYRNFVTANKTTNNGLRREIDLGGVVLESFWVESAMSYAAKPLETPLTFETDQGVLTIEKKGAFVLKTKFADEPFESPEVKNSFWVFAHHELPLHPEVLQILAANDAPPKYLEFATFGPRSPKGVKQIWRLKKRTDDLKSFKLPKNALSATERKPVAPIAFIINEAAKGKAFGGLKPAEKIAASFTRKMTNEAYDKAWETGHRYHNYTNACEALSEDPTCLALSDLETHEDSTLSKDRQIMVKAMALAKKDDAEMVALLKPYLEKPETPAFVIREAAMARARLKPVKAKEANVGDLKASKLLKKALAQDPYDPHTYVGLAQIYAAEGAFEQSWDVYDALRAGIPTVGAVELKVENVEATLRQRLPGYFID